MGTITVYRWRKYDIQTDETAVSRRYATPEAAERACGEIIPQTAIEIDEGELDPEMDGMTPRGYAPNAQSGFQTEVKG